MPESPRDAERRQMLAQSTSPQIRIPVQAADVTRRKRRIVTYCIAAFLAIAAISAWIYKRSVDPIHAMESYDSAVLLFKAARYSQVIIALDRTIALKPNFADAYLLRGRAHAGQGDAEPAVRDFTSVLRLRPNDVQALLLRAAASMDQKDYRSAIADATAVMQIAPQNRKETSQAYNLRGSAIRGLGNPQKALEDFDRAVDLDPSVDNFYQRAATYQQLGEHRLAIADLTQVLKLNPDEAPAYYARSSSRAAIGDLKGAKADRKEGLRLNSR